LPFRLTVCFIEIVCTYNIVPATLGRERITDAPTLIILTLMILSS
jgi:hypothetical protein